jgi:hypothetical protein
VVLVTPARAIEWKEAMEKAMKKRDENCATINNDNNYHHNYSYPHFHQGHGDFLYLFS